MDELSPEQMQELEAALRALQTELQDSLTQRQDDSKPVELDLPIGRLSRMDAIQQQKMAQANRRNQEIRLRHVTTALQAIEREEYGECRRCEEYISFARLKARPETPLCLACQAILENQR